MKRLIVGLAFVAAASVAYADEPAWWYVPNADGTSGVISNNNAVGKSTDYVLNVKVRNAAQRTLSVGDGTAGSAYAVVGGDTLDLSERIADANGEPWTIEDLSTDCLRSKEAPFVNVAFPRELKSSSGQQLNDRPKALESVVLDCPLWEGTIPAGFLTGTKEESIQLERVRVNLPRIKALASNSFATHGSVSGWNFAGLEEVNGRAFGYGHMTGILRLPNVRKVGTLNANMLFERVELGNEACTLAEVGDSAFSNPGNTWFYVSAFVIGGETGWKVGRAAFASRALQRVYMVGAVPTFSDNSVAFGASDAAEKSMAFYIPKDLPEWQAIADVATPLTDEELAAFEMAHPDWDSPFGLVAADVFQTAAPQYIGWIENRGDFGTKYARLSIGNRSKGQYEGDAVGVTVNGQTWDGGRIPLGAEVSVQARAETAQTRISWEGTLSDGTHPTGAAFTFTMARNVSLYVRFAHPWEYDEEAKTISDGYWTLAVAKESANALCVGASASNRADGRTAVPWAFPADSTTYRGKKGECDLTGDVYTKGRIGEPDARWTITSILGHAFRTWEIDDEVVTSFYAPETLRVWGGQVFNASGNYSGSLTNVVLRCPDLSGGLDVYGYGFSHQPIERFVLATPKVTQFGDTNMNFGRSWWGKSVTFCDTDLSDWDLTGMKAVGKSAFMVPADTGFGPTGTLMLPNLELVGDEAFYNWTRHTAAVLGTNGTLKSLGSKIFANNTSALKKLDFGTSAAFTVAADTFLAADDTPLPLEEAWFAGEAPSADVLDALLAQRTAGDDGTKPVKIYAPMMKDSWQARCAAFVGDERKAARAIRKQTGHRVVGVYVTQDGRRAAWLVQNPNFPYSAGLMFLIR